MTTEGCDHDWELIDESYDHEYGTETIIYYRCLLCNAEKDYEYERFEDDVL